MGDIKKRLYKFFVFSDVHGEFDALKQSLNEAGYNCNNPQHKLVSLGDNFDRGPDSLKVSNFLMRNHAICVKGNHDAMFQQYLELGMKTGSVYFNILHNGLGETIKDFTGLNDRRFSVEQLEKARHIISRQVLTWLQNMPYFYETKHFIFVHAGINPRLDKWEDTTKDYMLWDVEDSHRQCFNTDKIVVIGHHHTDVVRKNGIKDGFVEEKDKGFFAIDDDGHNIVSSIKFYGNTDENRPYIHGNKIAIDGHTNLTKKVNVLVIEDNEKEEPEPEPENNPESRLDESIVGVSSNEYTIKIGPQWCNYTGIGTVSGIYTTTNDWYNAGI